MRRTAARLAWPNPAGTRVSERFGRSALKLYGFASRLLGWRPQEFWAATPAELTAALASPEDHSAPLGRDDFNRMMEQDHGNPQ